MGSFVCKDCSLGDNSLGVFGRYLYEVDKTPERKIMIISDCPHDSDVRTGSYFSGKHGNNFITLLNEAGIDQRDVYVTGLCKCTPFTYPWTSLRAVNKENKIKSANVKKCMPRLIVEMDTVSPKFVLVFGEQPFYFFFKDLSYADNRGKILHNDEYNVDVLATYNPITKAYTNKFDKLLATDFKKFADHAYGRTASVGVIDETHKDYRFPQTNLDLLRAVAQRVKTVETFAFDIETHGQGLFDYKLLSIGISWKEHTGISVPVWVADLDKVRAIANVISYKVPKRVIKEQIGFFKNGKPKYKVTPNPGFKEEDREYVKNTLPEEYKYIAELPTLLEMKHKLRAILDKEPPLKKYWGDKHDECMALIKEIMECDTPKGAHNGSYDVNRLRGIGINVKNYAWDTILMHHLLDEERPHGLDDLSFVYTKDGGYKSGKNMYLQSGQTSWANIPLNVLLPYNAQDADVTLQLYHVFKPMLQQEGRLWNLFEKHVMPAQHMLCDMTFRGSSVDREWLANAHKEYQKKMHDLLVDFQIVINKVLPNTYVVADKEEQDKFIADWNSKPHLPGENMPNLFNLNSRDQCVSLFRDTYGLKLSKQTSTGDCLDADVLAKLAKKKNAAASILLEYKALSKVDSVYFVGMHDAIDTDGKIHGEFILYGTVTGRLASKRPNMQNIPMEAKAMFIPPKGYVCVNVDQSAAELHVLAWMAQDQKMMSIFEHKRDLHRETAAGVFSKKPEDISDEERKIAKRVSFGTAYGISGVGLAALLEPEGVKISEHQGDMYIEKWMKTYPRCASFLKNAKTNFRTYGFLENPFGRKRHKYKTFADKMKELSSERQACNYPIQSTASDIQVYEMIHMYQTLLDNGVLPVFTVHDSIVMYCPYDKLEWLRDYYKKETCRRFNDDEFPGLHGCLMYTEMEVGRNYGEHIKLPYDCDFQEWKEKNKQLFE